MGDDPVARRRRGCKPQAELDESSRAAALESVVDQHVFDPDRLERYAHAAGAVDVRVVTEELSAAVFGWPVRTFEAAVPPEKLGMGWAMFAYRTWQRLSWVDEHVLSRVVPRVAVLQRAGHRGAAGGPGVALTYAFTLDDVAFLALVGGP